MTHAKAAQGRGVGLLVLAGVAVWLMGRQGRQTQKTATGGVGGSLGKTSVQVSQPRAVMGDRVSRDINVRAVVTNDGNAEGVYTVELVITGAVQQLISVATGIRVSPGEQAAVSQTMPDALRLERGDSINLTLRLSRTAPDRSGGIAVSRTVGYAESHPHRAGGRLSGVDINVQQQRRRL